MPAVARNPVFTAMEIDTLARLYPDRFLAGLGHGVAHWMRQIGAFPKSQLAALEETAVTIREMLTGERLTIDQLAITGTPEDWALAINRLVEAGANTVVLVPLPGKDLEELDLFAHLLLRESDQGQ
jgi:alkanesulfonate monooxygenase SsuD/methylene tetrahydromethanopterin reductase-like flavin-dependent oxidoreductase (luciferase family)